MAVKIQSDNSSDELRVDPTSKAGRVTLYDTAGSVVVPAAEHTTAVSPNAARLTDGAAFYKATTPADTQPISAASLPLPTGAAAEHTTAGSPNSARLTDGAAFYDSTKTGQLPAALVSGRLDGNVGAWLGSTVPTVGAKTSADSVPVVIASDQAAVAISAAALPLPTGAATSANQTTLGSHTSKINDGTNTAAVKAASTAAVSTDPSLVVSISPNNGVSRVVAASVAVTTVASSISAVQLLAANTNRRGAFIFNDSTSAVFVKYGTGVTSVSFTVKITAGALFEFPEPMYTGLVQGIWVALNGAARITEVF